MCRGHPNLISPRLILSDGGAALGDEGALPARKKTTSIQMHRPESSHPQHPTIPWRHSQSTACELQTGLAGPRHALPIAGDVGRRIGFRFDAARSFAAVRFVA